MVGHNHKFIQLHFRPQPGCFKPFFFNDPTDLTQLYFSVRTSTKKVLDLKGAKGDEIFPTL